MGNKHLVATIIILIYLYVMFSFIGCTTTKYVPIESVRTEYINKVEKDTVIINNDRIIKEKGDTIYIVNTKYVFLAHVYNNIVVNSLYSLCNGSPITL